MKVSQAVSHFLGVDVSSKEAAKIVGDLTLDEIAEIIAAAEQEKKVKPKHVECVPISETQKPEKKTRKKSQSNKTNVAKDDDAIGKAFEAIGGKTVKKPAGVKRSRSSTRKSSSSNEEEEEEELARKIDEIAYKKELKLRKKSRSESESSSDSDSSDSDSSSSSNDSSSSSNSDSSDSSSSDSSSDSSDSSSD